MVEHPTVTPETLTMPERPSDSIPWVNSVFEQPWWLECVAPGAWGEAVVRRGDEVVARLPYALRQRVRAPDDRPAAVHADPGSLARAVGGQVRAAPGGREEPAGAADRDAAAVRPLPQCFAPSLTNWLPFHWAGFQATVAYTYRIEDLSDLDRVQREFQDHVRRAIRKAQRNVEIDHDFPLDELLRLDAQTYARQGLKLPHSYEVLRRLDAACAERGARRILGAVDADGRTHAVLYVVWDERTLYALMSARNPSVQPSAPTRCCTGRRSVSRRRSRASSTSRARWSSRSSTTSGASAAGRRRTSASRRPACRARSALAARSARTALGRLARRRG